MQTGAELLVEGVAAVCELNVYIQLHETADLHQTPISVIAQLHRKRTTRLQLVCSVTTLKTRIRREGQQCLAKSGNSVCLCCCPSCMGSLPVLETRCMTRSTAIVHQQL